MSKFSTLVTKNGYQMAEVSSSLQKSVRRCQLFDAMFWASELDLSGYGEYAFKRLRIIASEDIGLADNTAAISAQLLHAGWETLKLSQSVSRRLHLLTCAARLARARKWRGVDHALCTLYAAQQESFLPWPTYASRLRRLLEQRDEGGALRTAVAADRAGFGDEAMGLLQVMSIEEAGLSLTQLSQLQASLLANWRNFNKKKDGQRNETLFLIHGVMAHCRCQGEEALQAITAEEGLLDVVETLYSSDRPELPVPDYAVDHHTPRGRALGRGTRHFYTVAGHINNKDESLRDDFAEEVRRVDLEAQERKRPGFVESGG